MDETDVHRCINDRLIAQRRVMDRNVILRLYAHPRGDTTTNDSIRGCPTYCPQRHVTQSLNYDDRHEREPTPFDQTPCADDVEHAYDAQPYLEFRFDTVRSHSQGFLFGTDQICDFRLPRGSRLSGKHLCITFDNKRRLVVRDLGSTNGTAVTYTNQFLDKRRNFTWIIGGIDEIHEEKVVIHMTTTLKFRAFINYDIFANNGSASLIDQFRSQAMTDEDISAIQLSSQHDTRVATGMQTPSAEPFFLRYLVGSGTFGKATRHLDISTGDSYVEKKPVLEHYEPQKWENEIRIMQRLGEHENIVPLLRYVKLPLWRIYLPYYPLGNLWTLWWNQKPGPTKHEFTLGDVMELLKQCLAGLKHAHAKKVAHRDMKLSNILVESLTPFKIRLADFGESKVTNVSAPKTYCGTEIYMAPEVIASRRKGRARYSIACDLWSLGAVLSEVLFGRPQWPRSRATDQAYCDAVMEQTRKPCEADLQDLQRFLLRNLLVVDPTQRQTAAACYELAMALPSVDEPSRIMTGRRRPTMLPADSPPCSTTTTDAKEGEAVQSSEGSTTRPFSGQESKRRLEDDAEAGQEHPGSKRPFAGKKPCKRAAELRPVPAGDAGAALEEPASDESGDQTAGGEPPSIPAGASGAGSASRELRLQRSRAESAHRGPAVASARPGSPVHSAVSPVPRSLEWPAHEMSSASNNSAARELQFQLSRAQSAHRRAAVASARPSSPMEMPGLHG
ncbi:hypothetical protein MY11210_001116 [Beauveria gryllotalpidicola]